MLSRASSVEDFLSPSVSRVSSPGWSFALTRAARRDADVRLAREWRSRAGARTGAPRSATVHMRAGVSSNVSSRAREENFHNWQKRSPRSRPGRAKVPTSTLHARHNTPRIHTV
jgi:hypothetical protein